MHLALKQIWANPYVRVLVLLVALIVLYWLLARTTIAWGSFVLAYILAYLTNPLVVRLEGIRLGRLRVPRWVGVIVVFFLLVVLFGLGYLLASEVAAQVTLFFEELPELLAPFTEPGQLPRLLRFLPIEGTEALQQLSQNLTAQLQNLGALLLVGVTGIVGGIFQAFVILVLSFYILFSFPVINASLLQAFPESYRPLMNDLAAKLNQAGGKYLRAQIMIAFIVGFLVWLGLYLLGIPLALALGILAGVLNIVPYLGPIVAFVPALLLSLTLGWPYALGVVAVFVTVNLIDGNLLSPIVLSKATAIHPVTVVIAILAGASLFGLLGALIAVPAVAFLKLVYEDYYLESSWYKRRS